MAEVHHVLRARAYRAELGRWTMRGRFDWREWDGEFVVRADDTAATCLLSTLAGEIIKAMRDGAVYVDEIATRVNMALAPTSAATAALVATFTQAGSRSHDVLAALHELEAIGLVQVELA